MGSPVDATSNGSTTKKRAASKKKSAKRAKQMKPCKSNLIERFIDHVASGAIVGDGYTFEAPEVLVDVTAALRRILDGAEPDEALAIDRTGGGRADPVSKQIAYLWYQLRVKRGWSPASVAKNVQDKYGKELTEHRIRKIYRQHGEPELWRANDDIDELLARPRRPPPTD